MVFNVATKFVAILPPLATKDIFRSLVAILANIATNFVDTMDNINTFKPLKVIFLYKY